MIFGGIPKNGDPAIAETKVLTLGEHDYSKEEHYDMHDEFTCTSYFIHADCMCTKEGSISSGKLSVQIPRVSSFEGIYFIFFFIVIAFHKLLYAPFTINFNLEN